MRVNFLSFDYCSSFSSAGRSRQAKAESQKCLYNLAKKWCWKFRAVSSFVGELKAESFYLCTQTYRQNVWNLQNVGAWWEQGQIQKWCCTLHFLPRRAVKLNKLVARPNLTGIRTPSSLTLLRSTRRRLRLGPDLIFPEPCAYAASLPLSFVMSIPFWFCPFFPQKASRFVPVIGHVLLCFQAAERLLFVFFTLKPSWLLIGSLDSR